MIQHTEDAIPPDGLSDVALRALLADVFSDEIVSLKQATSDTTPAFNPIVIRDLIREATAAGRHPAHLVLGHAEADSYRALLKEEYGEVAPKDLKDSYFLGLHIVEEDIPSKLALVGEKSHDAWSTSLNPLWREDGDLFGAADEAA